MRNWAWRRIGNVTIAHWETRVLYFENALTLGILPYTMPRAFWNGFCNIVVPWLALAQTILFFELFKLFKILVFSNKKTFCRKKKDGFFLEYLRILYFQKGTFELNYLFGKTSCRIFKKKNTTKCPNKV